VKPAQYIAAHIRRVLKDGGSAPLAEDTQRFFKEYVPNHGWRTADLRKLARRFSRALVDEGGTERAVAIADQLFEGSNGTEKTFAVLLLENHVGRMGDREFRLFETWLPRITNWSDHDALVHYLIGPMMATEAARAERVFRWARSKNRWLRRAAAVALIQGTRKHRFEAETVRLTGLLLDDEDDMVQKGLGWLLREFAKADARRALPFLMKIRGQAPRLVLRTACETLPQEQRARVLGSAKA
jgi:3-methyladenine DNA glycosylase AlkD